MVSLQDKVIVVAGASSGIGKATAVLCASLGAKIALVSRNETKLNEVKKMLKGEGHEVFSYDLLNSDQIGGLVKTIFQKMGKINGLVYASGMEYTRPLKVINVEQLKKVYELNVFSAIAMAKEVTKRKYIGSEASIIFISSIVSVLGEAGKIGYASSKGALLTASKSMAIELASRKIRVNSILPALVETPMSQEILEKLKEEEVDVIRKKHPLGFGQPEDIANSIAFLLSGTSSWITGVEFVVDGGFSAT